MRNSCGFVVWMLAAILIYGCGDDSIVDLNITPDETMPGKIAFASDRDGNVEIYTMNADGSSLVQLTESEAKRLPLLVGRPMVGSLLLFSDPSGNF